MDVLYTNVLSNLLLFDKANTILSVIMLIVVAPLVCTMNKSLIHYYPEAVLALAPWAPQIGTICCRTAQEAKAPHNAFSAPQNRACKWGLRDQSSFAQYVDLSEEILILGAAV